MQILPKENVAILNICAKCLARDNQQISEGWRFPIIDGYFDEADPSSSYGFNEVTFVYGLPWVETPLDVSVVGTFGSLYEPVPLQRIPETPYFAVTIKVPKGEVHTYKFIVDGRSVNDPINPQRVTLDNAREWSRFFTQLCSEPLVFEDWEMLVLNRLTAHILPFRTEAGDNFLQRFYFYSDRASKDTQYARAYRLDQPVGVVNFIDKLLARDENQYLADYKICLRQIDRVMRRRNPYIEPGEMPREMYVDLYDDMWQGRVDGWDFGEYHNPRFFLQLLRRHTFTGAFSHPKYGGNAGASGWAYLEERFTDPETGQSFFNWRRVTEEPLGNDENYRG